MLFTLSVPLSVPRTNIARDTGQHATRMAVRAGESIPVPTRTGLQASESVTVDCVEKRNSPQGEQVNYTDAAARHQMNAGGL